MIGNVNSQIDHLVIGAHTLEAGRNYVYQVLGILPKPGGIHPKMGTHNSLLKLGNSVYLEVIAANYEVAQPERPRWFGLDEFPPDAKPRLLTWVVRTNDIDKAVKNANFNFGEIESMNRGNLEWLITVPRDGSMPMQGIAPTLIQWKTSLHPADSLPESGCTLIRIEGTHLQAKYIRQELHSIGLEGAFNVEKPVQDIKPSLIAYINTLSGIKSLTSH